MPNALLTVFTETLSLCMHVIINTFLSPTIDVTKLTTWNLLKQFDL